VRQRKIGAALAIVGVLLWVSFVVLQFVTEDLLSDNPLYLGITVGGAAVVAGIILIATTV
jgi:ABC-type Fe3+-siderophore transport system permease subunit